ncbi:hypothetical protein K503DRAFT_805720 [Rhizopogon vinicolor AM-OR11-026]|uniref:Uncharacterized protein n=1 Tax=Rhizopogon vinicolor AM-OR11-026 TaxID=1314800 RepID=A0A1B7MGX3_9AGAM|nr:hypothetical protein K503DRAFT_805720 [Rhizopogon vinicolor AM-OR11-026]
MAQDQHATQSEKPPILKSINPAHHLSQYQTFCNVESVYYNEPCTHAAIVLEVGFTMPFGLGERLKYALFPTRVLDTRLDRFPEEEEVVNMIEYNITNIDTLSPHITAGEVGVDVGSKSHQVLSTLYGILRLLPQRPQHDQIWWQFVNDKSNFFPLSTQLLLVVEGRGSPRFPIILEILPTLKVCAQMKRWHQWTNSFQTLQPKVDHGWSFQIENNYRSEKAKAFLVEYHKSTVERDASQIRVGLHAAMVSYLAEVKR